MTEQARPVAAWSFKQESDPLWRFAGFRSRLGCSGVLTLRELLKTNDLVLLSYAVHLLEEAGIECDIFDAHMSSVEGSIGAIPRRLMVASEDFVAARRALGNASITIES